MYNPYLPIQHSPDHGIEATSVIEVEQISVAQRPRLHMSHDLNGFNFDDRQGFGRIANRLRSQSATDPGAAPPSLISCAAAPGPAAVKCCSAGPAETPPPRV
jgi:hypothetical protein